MPRVRILLPVSARPGVVWQPGEEHDVAPELVEDAAAKGWGERIEDPEGRDPSSGTDAGADPGIDLENVDGIGPVYASALRAAGVAHTGDLAALDGARINGVAAATDIPAHRIAGWAEEARRRGDPSTVPR